MNFSEALEAIKEGQKVRRSSWKNKSGVIYLVEHFSRPPYIEYRYIQGGVVYVAYCDDILATDWEVLDEFNTSKR